MQEGTTPSAPSIPNVGKASGGFIAALALAVVGCNVATFTPTLVALPLAIQDIDESGKNGNLSMVLFLGVLVAVIANPVFGKLSDRTTSRFGMRRPWILGGALFGTLGLLALSTAHTMPLLIFTWCFTQAVYNALYAAEIALISDQVPPDQQGFVSGILGVAFPMALLIATGLAALLAFSTTFMIIAGAVIGFLPAVVLCVVLKDRHLDPADKPGRYTIRSFLSSVWTNPVKHPDFGWAWLSRLLMWMGPNALIAFMAYYLSDHLGVAEDQQARWVFFGILASTVALMIVSPLSGRLSDRLRRRKPFALVAAGVIAVGLIVAALAGSVTHFLIATTIVGIGQGLYAAVDYAVPVAVLPDPANAAKDLGVMNIALTLPGSVIPALAPLAFAFGGYPTLFVAGAALTVIGSLVLRRVRAID
ncbi:MFS transporter [Actinomadura sp. 9N407]|uniref:MFS transporter n=1 Tax=Actinomadura sp. 9N407 TaxID=3375154 RepID=UPI0037B033BF